MKNESKYIYNDYDEDQVQEILKKRKQKKRKKRRRIVMIFCIFLAIGAFFISDYSKIQSIEIRGNKLVSKEMILQSLAIVEHKSFTLLIKESKVKEKVEDIPMISSAKVKKDLFGNIEIVVSETDPLGYSLINNVLYIIDEKGRVDVYDNQNMGYVQRSVSISNMQEGMLKEFAKEFAKIPSQVRNQISDITYAPLSQDETRVQFYMDDGKILIVRIEDMANQLSGNKYSTLLQQNPNYKYYDFYGEHCYMS